MTISHPKPARSPKEMRAAINELRLHSPIVNACFKMASIEGASAEDFYALLAYHALCALAQTQEAYLASARSMPPLYGYQPKAPGGPLQPPPRKP